MKETSAPVFGYKLRTPAGFQDCRAGLSAPNPIGAAALPALVKCQMVNIPCLQEKSKKKNFGVAFRCGLA
jgi:hypothetical protein